MPNVGYATIQIIPSVRGISDEIRRQIVGPAGDAGGDAGTAAGGGLKSKLVAGAALAGAAAGALLVAGITEALDQSNVSSTLQAQLGTSNKVAAKQGKLAGKLYSSGVSGSFQEAADAIKAVVQSGLAPPDATNAQLEQIATKASDVASVFGQELGGVTNAVSQLIRTGLAKNSTEAFDLITKGFQSGADKGGDFLDTINEYGTQFRKAGLDGASAIGLLNQAIQGGARDADVAADAIKEFSIRAIDGSAGSAAGFKALGLNADEMGAKFAKGGKAANGVLDITLNRLRDIKDPVKQSQAAVALFGTQAEDLGKALLTMDPTSAAKGLGQIGGAADKVGKTIRSGPAHEIEIFKRALKQGFVDFIGKQVLPVVGDLAHGFNTYFLPPLRVVASVVAAVLLPALKGLWTVGASVVDWLRDMGAWLIPVGILVGGLTVLLSANAIATGATAAVFAVYRGAILAWAAVQRTAIALQAAWNAVMSLNPIGLIVIALIALGAALVVAYKKSDTFRAIVQGAWAAIQTAALWAWNNVLKPVLMGIWTGLQTVGRWATWLWKTILSPVFSAIATAAKILLTVLVVLVILPIVATFKILGAIATWLWDVAIGPAFSAIGDAAMWLWNSMLKPAFDNAMTTFRALGAIGKWLWVNVFSPVFGWIGDKAKWLWNSAIKPAFASFRTGFQQLADKGQWLWQKVLSPVFGWIADKGKWLWDKALKPAFDNMRKGVALIGDSFATAKDAIKKAWDKVEGIAKKPVRFIIENVYNGGIVPVWNRVAGAFGAPKLDKQSLKGFASGGRVHGPGTETSDSILSRLSRNEHVWTAKEVRGAGGHGAVMAMRGAAASGQLAIPGFAKGGGLFDWVKGAASKGVDLAKSGVSWLKDGVKASAIAGMNSIVKPLIDKISGSASLYKSMVTRVPKKMLTSIFDYSGKADGKLEAAGIGGKGYKGGLAWARTQAGKAYQWGGNGNPSWDCSGFVSAIESVIRGQKPHRRWATGAFSGRTAPPGWVLGAKSPYQIGITNAGVGHTAGTINGVNVESRGGDGVIVGSRARGYSSALFTHRYGFVPGRKYDSGGWLQPGVTAATNATGKPEAILTASQWRVAQTAMARTPGASLNGQRLQLVLDDGRAFDAHIETLADDRIQASNGRLAQALYAGGGS
ncbi:phage tail tape measure protein [Streptomyces sp. 900116325]